MYFLITLSVIKLNYYSCKLCFCSEIQTNHGDQEIRQTIG